MISSYSVLYWLVSLYFSFTAPSFLSFKTTSGLFCFIVTSKIIEYVKGKDKVSFRVIRTIGHCSTKIRRSRQGRIDVSQDRHSWGDPLFFVRETTVHQKNIREKLTFVYTDPHSSEDHSITPRIRSLTNLRCPFTSHLYVSEGKESFTSVSESKVHLQEVRWVGVEVQPSVGIDSMLY